MNTSSSLAEERIHKMAIFPLQVLKLESSNLERACACLADHQVT
jgi:hypothetical protein